MPCSVSREDELYYERQSNAELFGVALLDADLMKRIACEAAGLLRDGKTLADASALLRKWLAHHEAEDAKREAEQRAQEQKEQEREEALKALTPAQRAALGLK